MSTFFVRAAAAVAAVTLLSCGRGSSGPVRGSHLPIAGVLRLTLDADARSGSRFWAVLRRDGADEGTVAHVSAGTPTEIVWKEEVSQPRDWKLKFGPSRHPTYQLLVLPDSADPPQIRVADLGLYHDPEKALAIAYFAIPLDGEKALRVSLAPAEPLVVSVTDPRGMPLAGLRVVGIRTPRYLFQDGFDPERVDAMQLSWSWDFWNFDHVPTVHLPPTRLVTARTDASGMCRLEAFVGWAGVSERDERFAHPRSLLVMPESRSARFCVVQNPPSVRLTAEGLPGRDTTITERGLQVEGDWPLPEGFAPARWSERLSFLQAPTAEFFTPCRDVRIRPQSPVHRAVSGDLIRELSPGEARRHTVTLQETPYKTIEGEVLFEPSDRISREHCGIELYDAGGSGRLVRAAGSLGGPGVPKSGRVPFAFHVLEEGLYCVAVRTGSYSGAVVRDVRAPREDLVIRVSLDRKNIPCTLAVRGPDGAEATGFIVGAWPHRDLVNDFISGSQPSGKPGLNTFVVHDDAGGAVLRDVRLDEGTSARLEAVLAPGARLSGRLVDSEGRPLAGVWVHLSWPGYFRMASAFRWLADLTGPDGRFEIPHVPAGEWRLYVRGTGARAGERFVVPSGSAAWDAGDLAVPRTEAPGAK